MTTTNTDNTPAPVLVHREFGIYQSPYGFSAPLVNCFGCNTIESAQHAIDVYLDGNQDPQCKGPRVGQPVNHPTYGNCKIIKVHGMGTIDVRNIYTNREYRITGLPMN